MVRLVELPRALQKRRHVLPSPGAITPLDRFRWLRRANAKTHLRAAAAIPLYRIAGYVCESLFPVTLGAFVMSVSVAEVEAPFIQ